MAMVGGSVAGTMVLYPLRRTCRRGDVGAATALRLRRGAGTYRAAMTMRRSPARLPRPFALEPRAPRGAPGLTVRGEVDVAAVRRFEDAVDEAIRASAGAFVLDLCDVQFLDSSGLRVLLHARALLGREDRALAIVCPPGPVRRLFEVAGIADLLILYESREAAAAALVRSSAPARAAAAGRSTPAR
jgi:anti-sigma B factor antagonist